MKNFLFIIIISLIIIFGACKKSKQNKLIGSWKLLPRYAADTVNQVIYTFSDSNILYQITNDTGIVNAHYEVTREFTKYYVDINNLPENNGHYHIEKINTLILILQCYDPYYRKEFERIR